jgi:hypothetical protein
MGEKPMGVPATEDEPAEGSISTTRSNIRSGGGAAVAPGDPVPDIDVKIGK